MGNSAQTGTTLDKKELAYFFSEISPALLLLVDTDRRILYANAKALEFVGAPNIDAAKGKRLGEATNCDFAQEDDRGCGYAEHCQTCAAFKAVRDAKLGQVTIREMTLKNHERMSIVFRARLQAMVIDGENFIALMLHDISDEKRKETLEHLFYHDFLNAASGVLGLLEILELEEDRTEKDVSMLETARMCAEYLVDEINYSRAFSNAEKDALTCTPEPVQINATLEKVSAFFTMQTEGSGVRLVVEKMPEETSIITDKTLVTRVLINLVKNAIEASTRGSVVTMKAEMDAGKNCAHFEVHNNVVMPFEIREQIFDRAFSTKGKGRGIGTYSVKLFTEQYLKGKVWFTSVEGKGTSFYVEIPTIVL